ncbi:MAG: MraY family glycosyltransferase, partial [Gammaproteobacteria bacterium]
MAILHVIYFTGGTLLFAILATGMIRRYSLRHSLLDIPNVRSSHTAPTPRGGGLAIALSVLITAAILYFLHLLSFAIVIAFMGGGILVSITGWLDDHYDIPEIWKALSYTTTAIWAVYWLDGMEDLRIGEAVITLDLAGGFLAVLGCAWLINLYNFMDGTDALAAVQAICTGTFSGFLLLTLGRYDLAILCFVIATAATGFLYWNWPPARIFMGDVGSCFIGFSFGALAITGE